MAIACQISLNHLICAIFSPIFAVFSASSNFSRICFQFHFEICLGSSMDCSIWIHSDFHSFCYILLNTFEILFEFNRQNKGKTGKINKQNRIWWILHQFGRLIHVKRRSNWRIFLTKPRKRPHPRNARTWTV